MTPFQRATDPSSDPMREQLVADIAASGYFPELVADTLLQTVGDEEILAHALQQEPTFDNDGLHRHITVLALTATRLLISHTDETRAADPPSPHPQAATTTESVPLHQIRNVALSRMLASPEKYDPRKPLVSEAWLTVGWGGMRRIDLEPAACADPDCTADHGYTGSAAGDDLTVRVSATAEGSSMVDKLLGLGLQLQHLTRA